MLSSAGVALKTTYGKKVIGRGRQECSWCFHKSWTIVSSKYEEEVFPVDSEGTVLCSHIAFRVHLRCRKSPRCPHIVTIVTRHHLLPKRCPLDILLSLEGFIRKEFLPVQRDYLQSLYLWPLWNCGWDDAQDGSPAEYKPSRGETPARICWVKLFKKNLLDSLCVTRSAAVRRLPWCFPWKSSKCFYSNQGTQFVSSGKRHIPQWTFQASWFLLDMGSC